MRMTRIARIICGVLAIALLLAGFACMAAGSYLSRLGMFPDMEHMEWWFIGFIICTFGAGFFAIVMMNVSGHKS